MRETFRAEENQRYPETYRSREYNRTEEVIGSFETFRSAEYYEQGQKNRSSERKRNRRSVFRNGTLFASGMISAVGTVAGAAVIVVAVVYLAALSIIATAFGVTSYSINVDLRIENRNGEMLIACLQGDGKEYFDEIESGAEKNSLYFDFLSPDTEYLLEVWDEEGNIYFSQVYHTLPYEQKLFVAEETRDDSGFSLQFSEQNLSEQELDIYLNGAMQEEKLSLGTASYRAEGLSSDTAYEVKIADPTNGEILFMQTVRTEAPISIVQTGHETTSYSVTVGLQIEHWGGKTLTATLRGESGTTSSELEYGAQQCTLTFRFLAPDSEYVLEVRDEKGTVHLTQSYRTSPYEQKLFVVEEARYENGFFLQFSEQNLSEQELEIYLDGVKQTDSLSLLASIYRAEGLSPNTEYEVRISDPTNGELLFIGRYETGSVLSYEQEYLNAKQLKWNFYSEEMPSNLLNIYRNGELLQQNLTAADPVLVFNDLVGNTSYLIEIRNPQTQEVLLREEVTTPDVHLEITGAEISQRRIELYHLIESPSGQKVSAELYQNDAVIKSQSATVGNAGTTLFDDCQSFTEYYVRFVQVSDGVVLYAEAYQTASYFEMTTATGETVEDGKIVSLFPRIEDSSENLNEFLYYEDIDEASQSFILVCTSENGLSLPIIFLLDETSWMAQCCIFTQFARSGEIYELRLYNGTETSRGMNLVECRYFRVLDDGNPMEYPTFSVTASKDGTGQVSFVVKHTGGTIPFDWYGLASYSLLINGAIVDEFYLEDFRQVPTQTLISEEEFPPGQYTVILQFLIEFGYYTVYTTTVVI